MAKTRISVITVVYNGAQVLRKTLASVRAQNFDDFEYIVIDGGSADGTVRLIEESGGLVDRWVSEPDKGIYDAMNKAARLASGDYLYFLNAGDSFKGPLVLTSAASLLASDPVVLVGRVSVKGGRADIYPVDFSLESIRDTRALFASHFCHQALFVRRQDWLSVGGFSLKYPHFADFHNAVLVMRAGVVKDAPGLVVADFPLDGASSNWRKAVALYDEKERVLSDLGVSISFPRYLAGRVRAILFVWRSILRGGFR